jgi:mono/diheme cytochrome c family protein
MRVTPEVRRPLSLVLLGAVVALGCTGKYIRATSTESVQSTPERIERGAYLVNQAMSCGACHTTRERGALTGGERTDMVLAGNALEQPKLGLKLWIPNLTSDVETGLGAWSDDEIMRAIRDGVAKDGHFMVPLMPFASYAYVSDEDLRAVVAYLRSMPPVKHARTIAKNQLGFFFQLLVDQGALAHLPARDVPPPARADQDRLKHGEYVMRLGHCWECHSATASGPRDVGESGFLAGWDEPQELPGVGAVYFRNLTPDPETGLGKYTAAQIERALRTGRRLDGKPMAVPMSLFIPHLSGLTEEDMGALVAYLMSVPSYTNKIPERALLPAYERSLSRR